MVLTYDWSVDLGNPNSTITLQYHAVPPGSLVLDVGCATGFMGEALASHKACRYIGVELDADQALAARERGVDVLTGDVTDADDRARLLAHAGRRFDVVILGDVLEHLNDPFSVLTSIVDTMLDRGGLIVTSIPNVTHGSLRLDLMRGRFTYTRTGLLDVTHVQLFNRERVGELFDRAGLQVMTDQRSYFPVFGTEGRVQPGELPSEIEGFVLSDPESFTYQFITTGRPALTSARLAAGGVPRDASASDLDSIRVVVVGDPSPSWRSALDVSLPDRYGEPDIRIVEDPDQVASAIEDAPGAVLVIEPAVVPAASWLSPLLEAQRRHGGAVGAVRVSPEGLIDAAGWTEDGRAVGRGTSSMSELFSADRLDARLGLPWAADRAATVDADGRTRGRLVATSVAPSSGAGRADGGAPIGEVMTGLTVAVGERAPHQLPADDRRALVEAAAFGPVVYRWSNDGLDDNREHSRHLTAEGLTLIGGHSSERTDDLAPGWSTAGLARALQATRVVWLDRAVADREVMDVAVIAPSAIRVAPFGSKHVDRHDVHATLGEPPAPLERPVVEPESVPVRETVTGRISVVVPMYGLGALTLEALRCVRATTGHLDVELVVVDNGSPEADADVVRRGMPEAVMVTHEENLGFARGANAGIRASSGEFVCVLNNDTEPLEGWLDELIAALARPNVLMVGSRSDEISGPQRLSHVPRLADDPVASRAAGSAHAREHAGRVFPLARLVGFCLLARRDTFVELGGFCVPDALGNFEDDELSRRLLDSGGDLLVADGSVVLHHGSKTFQRSGSDYAEQMVRAARSLDAPVPVGALRAVVMSDGDASSTVASVRSVLDVFDDIIVVTSARGDELSCTFAGVGTVRVLQTASPVLDADRPHLVLAAGEEFVAEDVITARTALYDVGVPASIATSVGSQQRWVPGGRFDLLGPGGAPVEGLEIR